MKNLTLMMLGLGLATVTAGALNPAMASGRSSPCRQTAFQMVQACYFEDQDDYKTALANCTNLNDPSARHDCGRAAREASREHSRTCRDQFKSRIETCDLLREYRYDSDPLRDPAISFVEPDSVTPATANPYLSLVEGHTYVLRAGEAGDEIVVVHTTGEEREIQGVLCRVVVDIVVQAEAVEGGGAIEYTPVEVTDDWVAQDAEGNVYYCGELSRNYEDGLLANVDGSFEAGRNSAKGGLLIAAYPAIGSAHRQEFSLGEAEDIVQYRDAAAYPDNENPKFPCSDHGGCLQTYEYSPLEPGVAGVKYYIPGVGFVLSEALEDGEPTGERDSLECVGDGPEILRSECGIEDPQALIETLCRLAPEAFCD